MREKVGSGKVLLALSGGVDSSVLAALLSKAIGKQLTCIFVDHGFMRKNEGDEVQAAFAGHDINFVRVNAKERFMARLNGVSDPETKRKLIGEEFIRVFEEEAKKIGKVDFLAQGTIYPDVIESGSGDAAVILNENKDMRFSMPAEGTNIWCDGMVIPANAENPALAHEFINYMLTYDAASDNAETVGYSSPNAEVLLRMSVDPELYGNNEAYLPRSGYEKDEVYTDNPVLKKMISELWIKVKAA